MHKYATTFGGSEYAIESREYQEAIALGEYLAKKGFIVKCGGYYGLMEGVAKGVRKSNGTVIGITNLSFDPKKCNDYISSELKCNDIFERLRELIQNSQIFVIQHGSLGTLTELFLVWCLLYTNSIQSCEVYLIGKMWPKFLDSLSFFPIGKDNYLLVKHFDEFDDFKSYYDTK